MDNDLFELIWAAAAHAITQWHTSNPLDIPLGVFLQLAANDIVQRHQDRSPWRREYFIKLGLALAQAAEQPSRDEMRALVAHVWHLDPAQIGRSLGETNGDLPNAPGRPAD